MQYIHKLQKKVLGIIILVMEDICQLAKITLTNILT
jgi:hypothetical protein